MKKKFLISTVLATTILALSVSYSFATTTMTDNIANGVQNIASDVGGAVSRGVEATKNTVENAGNAISRGISTTTNTVDTTTAGTQKATNNVVTGTTNNYTATKTSTANTTVAGMNATTWGWLIIAVFGIAIVALIWYYGKQHSTSMNNDNE